MTRKAITENIKRRLYAESMGKCMNPDCQTDLFLSNGDIIEKAHIISYANTADNSFENLILLCPNCHTNFDKNSAFNDKEVKNWKRKRNEKVSKVFASIDDNSLYEQDMNSIQLLMDYMPFTQMRAYCEYLPDSININYTIPIDTFENFRIDNPHCYPFNDKNLTELFYHFINSLDILHNNILGYTVILKNNGYKFIPYNIYFNSVANNLDDNRNFNRVYQNFTQADSYNNIHLNKQLIPNYILGDLISQVENKRNIFLTNYYNLVEYLRTNYKNVNLNTYRPYSFD